MADATGGRKHVGILWIAGNRQWAVIEARLLHITAPLAAAARCGPAPSVVMRLHVRLLSPWGLPVAVRRVHSARRTATDIVLSVMQKW